jgi:GntR family carbon starvation induced transcriptional regulator
MTEKEHFLTIRTKSIDVGKDDDYASRPLVDRMRADIASSVHPPEAKLKFAALSERYCVGVGTLREALTQLASEGFVTLEVGKGFKVAPVSREELVEVTAHFIDLEKRALAESIQSGDEDWESNLVAVFHRLSIIERLPWTQRMERHSEWVERHREFHKALVAACPGRWLFRLRSQMFDQLDRYRFLTKRAPEGLGSRKFNEHRMIMEAALAHDVEKAVALIEVHIRDTSERVISLL